MKSKALPTTPMYTEHNEKIYTIEDGIEKYVPIKPICELMEIAFPPQFQKIKDSELYSPTVTLRVMVGADGKEREMQCLPLVFAIGWICSISPENTNNPKKVLETQLRILNTIYQSVKQPSEFFKFKSDRIAAISAQEDEGTRIMTNTYREIFDQDHTDLLLNLCYKQLKVHERLLSKRQHESDVSEWNRLKNQENKKSHLEDVISKLINESC